MCVTSFIWNSKYGKSSKLSVTQGIDDTLPLSATTSFPNSSYALGFLHGLSWGALLSRFFRSWNYCDTKLSGDVASPSRIVVIGHILAFCNENSFLLQNLSDFLGQLPLELLQKRPLLNFLLMAALLWQLAQETTACSWCRSICLRSTRSKPETVKIRIANQASADVPQRLSLSSGSMQLRATPSVLQPPCRDISRCSDRHTNSVISWWGLKYERNS